jgi:hypothetical protein
MDRADRRERSNLNRGTRDDFSRQSLGDDDDDRLCKSLMLPCLMFLVTSCRAHWGSFVSFQGLVGTVQSLSRSTRCHVEQRHARPSLQHRQSLVGALRESQRHGRDQVMSSGRLVATCRAFHSGRRRTTASPTIVSCACSTSTKSRSTSLNGHRTIRGCWRLSATMDVSFSIGCRKMTNFKFFFVVQRERINAKERQTNENTRRTRSMSDRRRVYCCKCSSISTEGGRRVHGDINDCRNEDRFDCTDVDERNGSNE